MKSTIRISALLITVFMLFALTACSSNNTTEKTAKATEATTAGSTSIIAETETNSKTSEKSITVGVSASKASWDPIHASDGFCIEVNGNVYGALYSCDNDGNYILDLAKSVDVSDNELTWTFTLRDDIFWSNGEPVTAHDFEYAYKRCADTNAGSEMSYLFYYSNIVNANEVAAGKINSSELGVKVKDDKTFVIELSSPCPWLESILSMSAISPVNQAFTEKCGDKFCSSIENMLFCGPYLMTEWDSASSTVVLEKNDKYWDANNVDIDKITFQLVSDTQSGVMAYENGDLDYIQLSGDLVDTYKKHKDYKEMPGNYNWYFYFNVDVVDNLIMRQAIAYAIDNKTLVNDILANGAKAQYNMIVNGLFTNSDGVDFNDVAEDQYVYDLNKAKGLWETAKAEGCKTDIILTYESNDETLSLVAQYLAATLQDNLDGLTIKLNSIPKANRLDNMKKGDFDVALHRWGPSYGDATATLGSYTSDSGYNWTNWGDKTYDEDIKLSKTTYATDANKRWELMLDAEHILIESCACVPMYQTGTAVLYRGTIQGLVMHVCGTQRYWKYVTISK